MIVAWTGHRPDLFADPDAALAAVMREAGMLLSEGAGRFVVGGQRGVDTWAALAAMKAGVPFTLVLPLPLNEFTHDWSGHDREILEHTISRAQVVEVAGGYMERNRVLATTGDLLVAVWTGRRGGGTGETIKLARHAGTPVREVVLVASAGASSARGRGI